jgi:uncharacterized RDD family membrane protein YckC
MGLRFPPSGFTDRTASRAGVHYASWLRRFAAVLIDTLIISLIWQLFGLLFGFVPAPFSHVLVTLLLFLSLFSIVDVGYATLCLDKLDGQTPGMRVMQIRCVPSAGHGRISFTQALVRSVVAVVVTDGLLLLASRSLLASLLLVIAYFWPLVDARHQTWWDHAADVVVMDNRGF